MSEETKVNFKNFQSKAVLQCRILKQDTAREANFISQLTETNGELERLKEKNETPLRKAEAVPGGAKRASKYTVASQFMSFVNIGCVLVLDSVAAYTLFNITKPCLL